MGDAGNREVRTVGRSRGSSLSFSTLGTLESGKSTDVPETPVLGGYFSPVPLLAAIGAGSLRAFSEARQIVTDGPTGDTGQREFAPFEASVALAALLLPNEDRTVDVAALVGSPAPSSSPRIAGVEHVAGGFSAPQKERGSDGGEVADGKGSAVDRGDGPSHLIEQCPVTCEQSSRSIGTEV
jgi:hypothetical protein